MSTQLRSVVLRLLLLSTLSHLILANNPTPFRGVNIGGWLVPEPFVKPSMYPDNTIDPWSLSQYVRANLSTRLPWYLDHLNTWVTYDDLQALKDGGITHLRVPIGHWEFETVDEMQQLGEPYLQVGWAYFVRLVAWCHELGLKVLMDLHTAPGSQNPWNHSGRVGVCQWGQGDTINRTLEIEGRIAQKIWELESNISTSDVIMGLCILNEPFYQCVTGGLWTIQSFEMQAYEYLPADKYMLAVSDGFATGLQYGFMSNRTQFQNVFMDLHMYQCFDAGERAQPQDWHLQLSCNGDKNYVTTQTLPTIAGEWSVEWSIDANDSPGEPMPSQQDAQFMLAWAITQMYEFESNDQPEGTGWFFWNFKTEASPRWDYLLGLRSGWIPKLPDPRVVQGCNTTIQQEIMTATDMQFDWPTAGEQPKNTTDPGYTTYPPTNGDGGSGTEIKAGTAGTAGTTGTTGTAETTSGSGPFYPTNLSHQDVSASACVTPGFITLLSVSLLGGLSALL